MANSCHYYTERNLHLSKKKLSSIKRNALLWPVTQRMVVIPFRRFGLKGQN